MSGSPPEPANRLEKPLGPADLMRLLPHRPPFFFVKRLIEWSPGARAASEVEFEGSEEFFRGHFPGHPIVPGVILVEAAAQTAGFALADSLDATPAGRMPALGKIRAFRFRSPVRPREPLRIDARVVLRFGAGGVVEVEITRAGEAIAEGELALLLTT